MTEALRRAWSGPLWVHVVGYAVVLLALLPLARPTQSVFTPDEGLYGLQVRALEDGRWTHEYAAERIDSDGQWFPLLNVTRGEDGWYPYAQHPAYPLALTGASKLFGESAGLVVLPLIGAVLAAALAWAVAIAAGRGDLARSAFWVAAFSPLLVNSTVVWAHTLSAAAGGLALVGVLRLRSRWNTAGAAMLALGVAAGVLLRSEGLLFAVAIAFAVAWLWRGQRRHALAIAVMTGGTAAVTFLAERAWNSSIVGEGADVLGVRQASESVSFIAGRLDGFWHTAAAGAYNDTAAGVYLVPVFALIPFAAVAARRGRVGWQRDAAVAVAGIGVLYALRFAVSPVQAVPGILVAWPLLLGGLILVRWRETNRSLRLLALVALAHAAAVFATQYEIGGGLEWGGRFLSPMTIPVSVLIAAGVTTALRNAGADRSRRRVAAAVAVVAVAPSLIGVAVMGGYRADNDRLVTQIASVARPGAPVVTHEQVLARFAWREHPELYWMLEQDTEALSDVLTATEAAGVSDLTLVVPFFLEDEDLGPYDVMAERTGPRVDEFGWKTLLVRAEPQE